MIFSWLYVLINCLSALLRQIGGDNFSPALILLMGCVFAVIYFHLLNINSLKTIYFQCWQNKYKWLALSCSLTITWICAVYSPKYIGASLYTFLFFSVMGYMGSLSLVKRSKKINFATASNLTAMGLLVVIAALYSTNKSVSDILGVTLAGIGGVFGFIYSKQSDNFMKKTSLNASQILCIRFFPAILLSLGLSFNDISITQNSLLYPTLIGIFCLIVPVYFAQKGIEKTSAEINSIICSTTPLATAILQQLYFQDVNIIQFAIYFAYALLISLNYLLSQGSKPTVVPALHSYPRTQDNKAGTQN